MAVPLQFYKLAAPMIVSRAGLAAMSLVDGLMVARFDGRQFAFLSLADATVGRLLDVFLALLMGALSGVPRHISRGDTKGARGLWMRTLPVALFLGLASALAGYGGSALLAAMGQSPELAQGAGPVMAILGAGHAAALLAISSAVYLEGAGRPAFVAGAIVAANLLNAGLNWLLIGGHLGIPAMGARGSALSTTIVRCALGLAVGAFAWRLRLPESVMEDHTAELAASRASQWSLGMAEAVTVAVMVTLTSSLTIFAGWLGMMPLAAFSAAWSLALPVMLVSLGLSDAAGIQVAAECGQSGEAGAAATAWSRLLLTALPVSVFAALLATASTPLGRLYSGDAGLSTAIAGAIPIAAGILLADSIGLVMAASLRAFREAAWPAGIEIASMAVLVPLAASLALRQGFGVKGLFLAMLATAVARAAALAGRFWWRTRGVPAPDSRYWIANAEE